MKHHLLIHSHQHTMRLDRLLHFGRHGVQISLLFIPGIEVEHWIQQRPQLLRSHLGNIFAEINVHERTVRIGLRLVPSRRNRVVVSPGNLQVLVPLLAVYGAAIDLETNVIVLDLHQRDVRRVARLYRRTPEGERLAQFFAVGRDHVSL